MERWKEIEGFKGLYEVSNYGKVRSWKNNKWGVSEKPKKLSKWVNSNGYECVTLWNNGKKYNKQVHRLVLKAFKNNPNNKRCCNHKDGNSKNNHISNLEWATQKENVNHAIKKGLFNNSGENHYNNKLTEVDVVNIRLAYKNGFTQKEISNAYDIGQDHVSRIVNHKVWKSTNL